MFWNRSSVMAGFKINSIAQAKAGKDDGVGWSNNGSVWSTPLSDGFKALMEQSATLTVELPELGGRVSRAFLVACSLFHAFVSPLRQLPSQPSKIVLALPTVHTFTEFSNMATLLKNMGIGCEIVPSYSLVEAFGCVASLRQPSQHDLSAMISTSAYGVEVMVSEGLRPIMLSFEYGEGIGLMGMVNTGGSQSLFDVYGEIAPIATAYEASLREDDLEDAIESFTDNRQRDLYISLRLSLVTGARLVKSILSHDYFGGRQPSSITFCGDALSLVPSDWVESVAEDVVRGRWDECIVFFDKSAWSTCWGSAVSRFPQEQVCVPGPEIFPPTTVDSFSDFQVYGLGGGVLQQVLDQRSVVVDAVDFGDKFYVPLYGVSVLHATVCQNDGIPLIEMGGRLNWQFEGKGGGATQDSENDLICGLVVDKYGHPTTTPALVSISIARVSSSTEDRTVMLSLSTPDGWRQMVKLSIYQFSHLQDGAGRNWGFLSQINNLNHPASVTFIKHLHQLEKTLKADIVQYFDLVCRDLLQAMLAGAVNGAFDPMRLSDATRSSHPATNANPKHPLSQLLRQARSNIIFDEQEKQILTAVLRGATPQKNQAGVLIAATEDYINGEQHMAISNRVVEHSAQPYVITKNNANNSTIIIYGEKVNIGPCFNNIPAITQNIHTDDDGTLAFLDNFAGDDGSMIMMEF